MIFSVVVTMLIFLILATVRSCSLIQLIINFVLWLIISWHFNLVFTPFDRIVAASIGGTIASVFGKDFNFLNLFHITHLNSSSNSLWCGQVSFASSSRPNTNQIRCKNPNTINHKIQWHNSKSFLTPFPRIFSKIRFHHSITQYLKDAFVKIIKYEGVSTLWRGLLPGLLMTIPSNAIYFTAYESIKNNLERNFELDYVVAPIIAGRGFSKVFSDIFGQLFSQILSINAR